MTISVVGNERETHTYTANITASVWNNIPPHASQHTHTQEHAHPVTSLFVTGLEFFRKVWYVKFPHFGHSVCEGWAFSFHIPWHCVGCGSLPVCLPAGPLMVWGCLERWNLNYFQSGPFSHSSYYCWGQETVRGPFVNLAQSSRVECVWIIPACCTEKDLTGLIWSLK